MENPQLVHVAPSRFVPNTAFRRRLGADLGGPTPPITAFIAVSLVTPPREHGFPGLVAGGCAVDPRGAETGPILDEETAADAGALGDRCPACRRRGHLVVDPKLATVCCTACGDSRVHHDAQNDKSQLFDRSAVLKPTKYAYKRSNHFYQGLLRSQGKENATIPKQVIDDVVREARIHSMDIDTLTATDVRMLLSKVERNAPIDCKIKHSKYYINRHLITYMINGSLPPQFTEEQERILECMFALVEEAFMLTKPPERKNIILTNYIMFKLCEIMMWDEFLPHYPLLVHDDKINEHDELWKRICEHLGWPFYPTCRI